jgi:uncharacterized protein
MQSLAPHAPHRSVLPNETLPEVATARVVHNRFIALLKPAFKSLRHDWHNFGDRRSPPRKCKRHAAGVGGTMARLEMLDSDSASLGEGPTAGDMLFELGMMYSVGRDMPIDLIAAHKWFNLAAIKGNLEAVRLRREITCQMSNAEIALAQRAARDWLVGNRVGKAPAIAA